jgi:glycosyltransferase involved in cell wall biosynthesis
MKVALTCPNYFPYIGGVETHVKEISERLVRRGFDVEVLTTDSTGRLQEEAVINNVRVKRFKSFAPQESYYLSRGLEAYLKKNSANYEIVHSHSYASFPSLYAARAKTTNNLIFTPHYHGAGHSILRNMLYRAYRILGRKIFEKTDRIVCVSNYEKNLLLRHFTIDDSNVVVIPNGLELQEFRSTKKRNKRNRTILYVGRLEKYKGIRYLMEVLPRLGGDVNLEIVGKGPYGDSLMKLSKKLDILPRIKFSHDLPREELLQKYADADVFVLLSRREAFGICVAEALASKTPCVLARGSSLDEWIDDKNCFGIDYPLDIYKLAAVINHASRTGVGEVKLWDWDEVVAKLIDVYSDALNV